MMPGPCHRRRRTDAGFTLLEMLVVLIVAGMALTLGFQALGQWQRAQQSVASAGHDARNAGLLESWLRECIGGLSASDTTPFKGDKQSLGGASLNPITADSGRFTPFHWLLERGKNAEWRLAIDENGEAFSIPLTDVGDAWFTYYDKDGTPHAQWPPALGLQAPLPAGVSLNLQAAAGTRADVVWLFRVRGPLEPLNIPFEMDRE